MADELKPVQEGEPETADEAKADSAGKEDEISPDEEMRELLKEEGLLGKVGPAASAALETFKKKASGLAGKMKETAGKLSEDLKNESEKKKAAKKEANYRTFEEEMADLAEEEKRFDEWGRPIRRKRRRRRKKSRMLSCTLVLLTLIISLSSVLAFTILIVAKEMYGIDKSVQKHIVTIPAGASTADIALQLQQENMITLPQVFRLVSRMNGKDGSYIAGEHTLTASMSYEAMIEELCTNEADERESQRVLIREGMTLVDVAKTLRENEIIQEDEESKFLYFFNRGGYGFKFEEYLPTETNSLKWQKMEGYCFPDTYEFYVHEDPEVVAQKIYKHFDEKLTDGDYVKMEELGMTLDEVITMASMVQGEASNVEYMKKVASVFHNRRLHKAEYPKYESDPTRKYAELIADNQEIQNETMITAYNTYKSAGLPPGAINNPGREAIEAVLYPAQTNYFYFNSNIDTGETFFAETYDQHKMNLAIVEGQYAAAKAAANGQN